MSQDEGVQQAKEGNPQAIAALISRSLSPKGMAVKAKSNNGCLMIQIEAQTTPSQQGVVNFVKNGLLSLQPSNVSQVVVQGRVSGQTTVAWQESFNLEAPIPKPSTNQPRPKTTNLVSQARSASTSQTTTKPSKRVNSALETVTKFIKTRNGERVAIGVGASLLTSIFWLNVGGIGSRAASPGNTQATSSRVFSVPGRFSLQGTFVLIDSEIGGIPSNCYGTGGYDDIEAGMPVTIRDGNGSILATGEVGAGSQPSDSEYASVMCSFDFQVDDIPKADFYSIQVGRRGELNYSFAEMQEGDWTVELSLGT